MSLAHELRVLELESQVELLERLQLLTNFGSNLVTVAGELGSGKSWLAQRYLEAWASEKNQCLLLCHPSQGDQQRRALILSQIVSNPLFNEQDSLSDSLTRLLDGEPCDVVIVIDDAHQLTEVLVSELWMLVLEAQANPLWNINIVLFSEMGSLDTLLTRLSYGQEHKPIDLEIDVLSALEAEQFFESLVVRYVDDSAEKRVRSAFKKVKPTPGELMALGELKVEKRIIIRSIIGSPKTIALLIALLLVMIGGGYWWMLKQPTPNDKAQALISPAEQTAIPTLDISGGDAVELDINAAMSRSNGTSQNMDPSYKDATDDSSALPPVVVENTVGVGSVEQDQQRVVITSDVVDALLDGKPESADTSSIEAAVEENTVLSDAVGNNVTSEVTAQGDPELPLSGNTPSREPSVVTQAQDNPPAAETPPSKTITFSFAREELKALSPRAYTLQLGAMTSLEDVQLFIEQYDIEEQARVYPTIRNGIEWFIIVYQDYPTIQVARDTVETLPTALQNLGPWAKSMNQVHREIERAN